jgi:hypothetical protein
MAGNREISLLPKEDDVNSLSSRVIRWVTTVGRFIIVFTELIVISAFLSRFWLDRKNSDLSDIIRQQKAILESTSDFEKDYLSLQTRLKLIKQVDKPQYLDQRLVSLSKSTPPDILFETISLKQAVDGNLVADLSTSAQNESAIVDFITNLYLNQDIDKVEVKRIEKKPKESKFIVNVVISFKNV